MSSLPWTNLNPNIKLFPTTKKFYNRYTNKVTYHISGIYIIPLAKKTDDIDYYIVRRSSSKGFDIPTLKKFLELYLTRTDKIKFRCEGNSLSLFADNESELYDLANGPLYEYRTKLKSITSIQNETDRQIVESGSIIMRKSTNFKYKVTIRNSNKHSQDRVNLANYINNVRSEIKISDFLLRTMLGKYKYLHSCYFYVNDPKIIDMIALISPNLVKRIQEVVIR